jgi:hypothetical protein
MAWGLLASPTCPPNGPSNIKFLAFPSNSAAFEPVSAWRRSLLPGNAILRPETKARKWPLESTWPLAETKHQHASPPIRGFSPKPGKSPLDTDCVVALGGLELRDKDSYRRGRAPAASRAIEEASGSTVGSAAGTGDALPAGKGAARQGRHVRPAWLRSRRLEQDNSAAVQSPLTRRNIARLPESLQR